MGTSRAKVLTLSVEAALVALFRAVVEGEEDVQRSRQTLCRLHDFKPRVVFAALAGSKERSASLRAGALCQWLDAQPRGLATVSQAEVMDVVAAFGSCVEGGLSYEEFLRVVAVRSTIEHEEVSLAFSKDHGVGRLPTDVAHSLCQVLMCESAFHANLWPYREKVRAHGLTASLVRDALATEGDILEDALRHFARRRGALTDEQCTVLIRRLHAMSAQPRLGIETLEWLLEAVSLSTSRPARNESVASLPLAFLGSVGHVSKPLSDTSSTAKPASGLRTSLGGPNIRRGFTPQNGICAEVARHSLRASPTTQPAPTPRGVSEHATPPAQAQRLSTADTAYAALGIDKFDATALRGAPTEIPTEAASAHAAVRAVLSCMLLQGELQKDIQAARAEMPDDLPLEAVFATLDHTDRGCVTQGDLYHFGFGCPGLACIPYEHVSALVWELQHFLACARDSGSSSSYGRRDRGQIGLGISGRLSFRELGALTAWLGSPELQAVARAESDEEARSELYVLRHSTPCPRCGCRAQRDANSACCPLVTCPICSTAFRCLIVAGDGPLARRDLLELLPQPTVARLHALVKAAGRDAHALQQARRYVWECRLESGSSAVTSTFGALTCGHHLLTLKHLREGLVDYGIWFSERDLGYVWKRFAGGSHGITLADFSCRLRPHDVLDTTRA